MEKINSLPWHIHFDKNDNKKGDRYGRLIHVREPQYECRFYIGKEPIETTGFAIHNVSSGVQLYDVTLPNGKELISQIKEINLSMKDGANFLYNILYPPFFRKMSDKEKIERAINDHKDTLDKLSDL